MIDQNRVANFLEFWSDSVVGAGQCAKSAPDWLSNVIVGLQKWKWGDAKGIGQHKNFGGCVP